jgi:hypothetical protein
MKLSSLIALLLSMIDGRSPEEIPSEHFVFFPDQTTLQEIMSIPSRCRKDDLSKEGARHECNVILLKDERLAIIPRHLANQPWARSALKIAA